MCFSADICHESFTLRVAQIAARPVTVAAHHTVTVYGIAHLASGGWRRAKDLHATTVNGYAFSNVAAIGSDDRKTVVDGFAHLHSVEHQRWTGDYEADVDATVGCLNGRRQYTCDALLMA